MRFAFYRYCHPCYFQKYICPDLSQKIQNTYKHTHTHTYTQIHKHTHTHKYTQKHTHTQAKPIFYVNIWLIKGGIFLKIFLGFEDFSLLGFISAISAFAGVLSLPLKEI